MLALKDLCFFLGVFAVCCSSETNRNHSSQSSLRWAGETPSCQKPSFQECVMCLNKPKNVRLHVLDKVKKPFMDMSYSLSCTYQKNLLGMMQEAATADESFRFTATYFNEKLGFYVDAYNNVSAHCCVDNLFWEILDGSLSPTPLGVSNYEPSDGETVTFNVTSCSCN